MTSDTDWKAEMERWRHGINVETATDEDIADFTIYKLWEYKEYETMDIALWSFFQDDFGKFDVNTFSRIHAQRLKSMYNFLRRGGVYVRPKDKRVTYAQLLFELTQEEQQHVWTQEELDEVYTDLDGNEFKSNRMNNAIKRGLNYKVTQDPTVRTIPFQSQQQQLSNVQNPTPLSQPSVQSRLLPFETLRSQSAATLQLSSTPQQSTAPAQTPQMSTMPQQSTAHAQTPLDAHAQTPPAAYVQTHLHLPRHLDGAKRYPTQPRCTRRNSNIVAQMAVLITS